MAGVNGETLTVTIDGVAIGSQTNFTRDDNLAFIDTSVKGVRHQSGIGGRTDGTVSCDALFIYNDAAQVAIETARKNATSLTLNIVDSGAGEDETCSALCTSISRNAPDQDVATWSATFQKTTEWSNV